MVKGAKFIEKCCNSERFLKVGMGIVAACIMMVLATFFVNPSTLFHESHIAGKYHNSLYQHTEMNI